MKLNTLTNFRALALVLLLVPFLHGCQASPAFSAGAKQFLPDVATEIRFYANRDAALDTATKADRLAQADRLDAAVKASPITLQVVKDEWANARALYTAYIDADDKLTPTEKSRRAHNVARMDELIATEGKRFIYPTAPAP